MEAWQLAQLSSTESQQAKSFALSTVSSQFFLKNLHHIESLNT
jgi:hypothetical protein